MQNSLGDEQTLSCRSRVWETFHATIWNWMCRLLHRSMIVLLVLCAKHGWECMQCSHDRTSSKHRIILFETLVVVHDDTSSALQAGEFRVHKIETSPGNEACLITNFNVAFN